MKEQKETIAQRIARTKKHFTYPNSEEQYINNYEQECKDKQEAYDNFMDWIDY